MQTSLASDATALNYKCRICGTEAHFFHKDKKREYLQCPQCRLVFVPAQFMLSPDEEKAEYDLHDNKPGDAGYEKFLSRTADPLIEYLSQITDDTRNNTPRSGLDFGCGPSPVLAEMLARPPNNFVVDPYDLYYFPHNANCLARSDYYDFITATEVVEHLQGPLTILRQLWNCLRSHGGVLAIMTKRVEGSVERFRNWHYTRDPTHITFFHEQTFLWLAKTLPRPDETCQIKFCCADVVFLIKNRKVE